MPDIWMDVDIALSEVPVNIFPLTDDTDFKTREVSIAYDQAGMDLAWNFVTTGGAYTRTAVTPTTAGVYDWVHQGDGMYSIEIPDAGGVSINNDTEGFGWFTGYCTGVLPWRGPVIGLRAAGLNNKLIDDAYSATRALAGTALPDAVAAANGGIPTTNGTKVNQTVDLTAATITDITTAMATAPVGSVTGSVGSVTGGATAGNQTTMLTHLTDIKGVGWATETLVSMSAALALIDVSDIADGIWNEDMTGHVAANSAGLYMRAMYALATGRLKIDDATKQLILYMADGVTEISRWNLYNSSGVLASSNVFDRQRV